MEARNRCGLAWDAFRRHQKAIYRSGDVALSCRFLPLLLNPPCSMALSLGLPFRTKPRRFLNMDTLTWYIIIIVYYSSILLYIIARLDKLKP